MSALEAEVAAYVNPLSVPEVDEAGRWLAVRSGHAERRTIETAAGAVAIQARRVVTAESTPPPENGLVPQRIVPPSCRGSP